MPHDPTGAPEVRLTEMRQSQSIDELQRKAKKAARKGYFTQEDIDYARSRADEIGLLIQWDTDCADAGRQALAPQERGHGG